VSVAINQKNLALSPKDVSIPDYDRAQLTLGFVHFGVGNFHRAHMAIYLDRLFALGEGNGSLLSL
jgi:mannitol 2-dehydrogenase